MRLFLALLSLYHAYRARACSRAYRRHMERCAAIMGRIQP